MRATFDLIEAGAERGNATAARALEFISATIGGAFDAARLHDMPRLDGSDSCERVAEALAVWLKESAPRAFADMTGTRYAVTGLDCSAEGMERLRNQREFILLAYPGAGTTAAEVGEQWRGDVRSRDAGERNPDALATVAVLWAAAYAGSLNRELRDVRNQLELETEEAGELGAEFDAPSFAFRLYVEESDNAN